MENWIASQFLLSHTIAFLIFQDQLSEKLFFTQKGRSPYICTSSTGGKVTLSAAQHTLAITPELFLQNKTEAKHTTNLCASVLSHFG